MNHIYRIVRNRATGLLQAVSEIARNQSASSGAPAKQNHTPAIAPAWLTAAALGLLPLSLHAAPVGGQISAGQGSITHSGHTTTITQSTPKLAINWQSFGTQAHESIHFAQPGANAIALNRVTGNEASLLLGSLTANGQIFIINPNGILFGKNAQVNVGGLVASTRSLSDQDFMNGHYQFSGEARSRIDNLGTIAALPGGYVALIASDISNQGTINTPQGRTELAAGERISLQFADRRMVGLSIDRGTLQSQIDSGGVIFAEGGIVHITAKGLNELSKSVINHTGLTQANTSALNEKGEIVLLASTTNIAGTITATATHPATDGGFIETSGKTVNVKDKAFISTKSKNGKNGTWLIDPEDITISASGGNISGTALSTALGSGSVILQTGGTGASASASGASDFTSTSTTNGNGDIFVNDTVAWSANTLTLNAHRNIFINQKLNGSGTAQLALEYGQGSANGDNIGSVNSDYFISAPVNLPAGENFSTKKGSSGTAKTFTVITALGSEGSTTQTDLQGMSGNLTKNYALGADIDASATSGWDGGAGFAPIGKYVFNNSSTSFTGTFDGLGHSISGLTIERPAQNNIGLFGSTNNANIQNISLLAGSIKGIEYVGALVAVQYGSTISNSYSTGTVSGTKSNVGGLVGGQGGSTISNSYSTSTVSGTSTVGGLVGSQGGGTISNSYSTGTVTGTESKVGGLVGSQNGGTISNSYSTGVVTGTGSDVGGLVGSQWGGTISNSYSTGAVTGANDVGGLVGYQDGGTITDSFWDKDTTKQQTSAGSGATGLSTADALTQNKYTNWDFTNTWYMVEGQTRPLLRAFKEPLI